MTTDELRAKFEAWANLEKYDLERSNAGWDYGDAATECAWRSWQAAHASRDAEVEALRRQVGDLAALVRRLAHSLDKPNGNTLLARQASDYLRRHDLQGTPMREESK